MVDFFSIVFTIIVLMISVVIHEYAHGAAAAAQGDMTAKYAGRLTLNPLKHIDLWGSVIIPFFLAMTTGIGFGYAKPVPINPYNFRDKKFGMIKVAAAGIAANFALALFCGLIIRIWPNMATPASIMFLAMMVEIVRTNLWLTLFNLVPIPPLDGSHILFAVLPQSQNDFKVFLQKYGLIFFLIFVFYFSGVLAPIVEFLGWLITGVRGLG